MRTKIVEYLGRVGEASTADVFGHINDTMHGGTTMAQLGNVLAKDPRFVCVATQRVANPFGSAYIIHRYNLADDYAEYAYR